MESENAKLLPFYLVIDVSYSMSGSKLDAANEIMPRILDALAENPILGDKVRFGVIDFADDAQVRLPLCDLLDPNVVLPSLELRGGTGYASAFNTLRQEIESNVAQLKADQYVVHRPTVWFISDGAPTDDEAGWRKAFADLTGSRMYPNFIPCGVDHEVDEQTLGSLIHPSKGSRKPMAMYMLDPGFDPAKAIMGVAEILISSMIASGRSLADGQSGTLLPSREDLPAGITQLDPEDFV